MVAGMPENQRAVSLGPDALDAIQYIFIRIHFELIFVKMYGLIALFSIKIKIVGGLILIAIGLRILLEHIL
jgi:hypothetical protein